MEVAPELTFRHHTLAEARLPVDAFVQLEGISPNELVLCCDLDAHVFNPEHTDPGSSRRCAARTGSTSASSAAPRRSHHARG